MIGVLTALVLSLSLAAQGDPYTCEPQPTVIRCEPVR
jgi:hypothetical protein